MGFFDKLKKTFGKKDNQGVYLSGFRKTQQNMSHKLNKLNKNYHGIDDEFLEDLTIALLESDIGIHTADKICQKMNDLNDEYFKISFKDAMEFLLEIMQDLYLEDEIPEIVYNDNGPTVILMVGVNGSGKTTSTAKLINYYQQQDKSVCVVAADTFRAGAVDQLVEWAHRLEVPCIKGEKNADPSSVIVDGLRYAKENNIDIVICDTAGRLQNKVNLMHELNKMHKVCDKEIPNAPHNVWLVLDATTGQNGISQAKIFKEVTNVTGIILTKMDGTAKGGVIIAIKDLLKIPVYFIGLGEKANDLRPFDLDSYLYAVSEGIR